jgi:hypothetical protein
MTFQKLVFQDYILLRSRRNNALSSFQISLKLDVVIAIKVLSASAGKSKLYTGGDRCQYFFDIRLN